MPLVSAIIPAYNGTSRYLEQAIGSVLSQTFQDCEIIVVDDASTDETGRLVMKFPQVRYIRPSLLEETIQVLQADPDAALVHCDGYQVNEQNEILEYDAAMKYTFSITQLLRGGHDVATAGSLFRRTCFDVVGGYDEGLFIWEDIDLAIRLYQRFRILHLPKPLYRHRLYDRNASRNIPSQRALLARERFLLKHGPSCKPASAEDAALTRDWAHYYGDLGKLRLAEGRLAEARQAFWQAVRREPLNRRALLRLIRAYLTIGSSQQASNRSPS